MSGATAFVSHVKQFSAHDKLDKVKGVPTVKPLSEAVKAINGDTPEVRSEHVNDRMKELGARIVGGNFALENTVPVGGVSQSAMRHLVRVKNMDKEDLAWVRVEGCKEAYGVADVTLEKRATPYSMYPGKVFGLTGEFKYHGQGNIKGLKVTNPLPMPTAGKKRDDDWQETMHAKKKVKVEQVLNEGSFKVMVAAGPFDANLQKSLQYVKRLLAQCSGRGTGALIVVGPLSLEREGDDIGYLDEDDSLSYFPEEMKGALRKTRLVFVPSLDDPFNEYVYPQPGYTFEGNDVVSLSNPGRVQINGVDFGITSLDIIKALRQDMTHNVGLDTNVGTFYPHDPNDPTSLKPAQRHAVAEILASGSFYPPLPPHPSIPLDVSLSSHLTFGRTTPDILILPSMQTFAEAVQLNELDPNDKVVVVNPGQFTSPLTPNSHGCIEITVTKPPNQQAEQKPLWQQVSIEWLTLERMEKK